ncbi:MAG: aminodeoxychorismate/anthranilate synthase component II [Schwartzia succinivorans]|nr:aminodeoxychorismate/anthranilate synthase component II [Schwartzia succinivorans]
MLLLLDNYDSFTYNIYQLLAELGAEIEVVRNDAATVSALSKRGYSGVVISPGPGEPKDAGVTEELIHEMKGVVPILGVCLGHQAIGEVFGGKVVRAPKIVHGKTSRIRHDGVGIYRDLPQPFDVGRYHSLILERETLPDCLAVTAETEDGIIMGVRHKEYDVEGVQFHPESILTPEGRTLLGNFLWKL